MLIALILPVSLAIIVDMIVGLWPLLTLVVASFAFPIAGIVMVRSTMQELQKVIDELAPETLETKDMKESTSIGGGNATGVTEL